MGLYSLAKELEKEGFKSEILHLGVEKYLDKNFLLSDYVKNNSVKFVAFSLHWHPQSYDVIETARILKEKCPETFIMLGGFTSSYFAQEIMEKFPFIDAIVKGEGEIPMRRLARKIYENDSNLKTVPNLYWRKNNRIVINKECFAAKSGDLDSFEFFDIKKMKNYKSYARIPFHMNYNLQNQLENRESASQGVCLGRGCTGNCTWCGGGFEAAKQVTGRDFIAYRNPDNVIDEIKMLKNKCGIEMFRFAFDPHPKDRRHLIELLNKIEKEFHGELKTSFTLNGLPDKETLNAYSKAFSKDSIMAISPEFFSEDLRRKHKSFYYSNQDLEEILTYMDKLEIQSELYFSTLPMTSEQDNKDSERYGEYLKDKYSFVQNYYVVPIVFEPAAPWTMNPEKYGLKIEQKTFINYYNDTKCIDGSFENPNAFVKELYPSK